ncbi:kinase-like domain-containing protein [Mycena rebaudengoi]|nr:kinase-like domain-containing protein [Mycena rebaudengoi]
MASPNAASEALSSLEFDSYILHSDAHLFAYLKPQSPNVVRIDLWRDQKVYNIGRHRGSNELVLEGMNISNRHAKISWNGRKGIDARVKIRDYSRNGTFVNGDIVNRETGCFLKQGDEIFFGAPEPVTYEGGKFDYRYIYYDITTRPKTKIQAFFTFSRPLGAGTYGEVVLAYEKATKKAVAIKRMKYTLPPGQLTNPSASLDYDKNLTSLVREITLMQAIKHPHVVELYTSLHEGNGTVYLVMEYLAGGTLLEYLNSVGHPYESIRDIMYQLCRAMEYMHNKSFVHRDLKPDNILLAGAAPPFIKVADFGSSIQESGLTPLKTMCGTCSYMAPEVLANIPYDSTVDCWSAGMILFTMLIHGCAFGNKTVREYTAMPPLLWGELGEAPSQARELLELLVVEDPNMRLSFGGALQHAWLKHHQPLHSVVYPCIKAEIAQLRLKATGVGMGA